MLLWTIARGVSSLQFLEAMNKIPGNTKMRDYKSGIRGKD